VHFSFRGSPLLGCRGLIEISGHRAPARSRALRSRCDLSSPLSFPSWSPSSLLALATFLSVVYAGIDTAPILIQTRSILSRTFLLVLVPHQPCHIDLKPPRRPPCFLHTTGHPLTTHSMMPQSHRRVPTSSSRHHILGPRSPP
jgi:hypothetical protein